MNSIHLVLSLTASSKWEVHQMDVKSTFLLKKSVYGLRQAPRAWYAKMDSFLLDTVFSRCHSNNIVYTKKVGKSLIILVLYVDDLIFTGSDHNLINHVKSSLKKQFEMIDLGHLHYFLGLQVSHSKEGISLSQSNAEASPLLVGFTDFDWAGDLDDRKSIAGYVFTLSSRPITWACKKQSAISLSSAKAEYCGAIEASKEAPWLLQILLEFGFQQQHLITLWCNNQSAIQLCKDLLQRQHNKHIEIHMHFIRKLIHDHLLEVQHCSIDDQVADIFTKTLT
eukprot:PITA_04275